MENHALWLIVDTIIITISAVICVIICNMYKRRISEERERLEFLSRDRLIYIQTLIEMVYLYKHNPQQLLEALQTEMSIRKLCSHHILDIDLKIKSVEFEKLKHNDQLFYQLYMSGFSTQMLCTIFGLNNLNSVYVKSHRINKHIEKMPDITDNAKKTPIVDATITHTDKCTEVGKQS